MKLSVRLAVALALSSLSASAGVTQPARPSSPAGIDLAGMDRAVAPGDDFFLYANGSWFARTEIPPDRSSYGVGAELVELTNRRTADLIASAAKANAPAGSEARKVGDYYASFLDVKAIEALGVAPLAPELAAINGISDLQSLSAALGRTLRADVDVLNATNLQTSNLFGLWVAQDLDDPSRYSPFLLQGGLGMPDRDYYLDPSPRMDELRKRYQAHVARMLELASVPDAAAKAARIVDLERKLAQVHATRVESEDVEKGNNHWSRKEFDAKAPGLDWSAYFAAAGLGSQADFVVWQPKALIGESALVRQVPIAVWKEYLTFQLIDRSAGVLPAALDQESFDFYAKTLSGTPKQRERWKRAVDATSGALGEAVGKLYVQRYFPPAEKARAEEMVHNVIAAFARRIDGLSWMAPETRAKAKAKLSALRVYVGYPDTWRDYSALQVVRGDAFGNAERASLFELHRNLQKLGKPVDRAEWAMTPQLVNAVNLPAMNALNFPAAILQPPYFDPSRPAAMDYGSAGAIIGHEISHSFDDQGALFDETGRLKNWWTPADFAHFKASSGQLIEEFNRYRPFPDAQVNGKLTISENIADLAGLSAAFDAYRHSLQGAQAKVVAGLSGDQQFFISFAQSWRQKIREPAARQRLLVDGHAPDRYRADTVRNLDAWYDAFGVKLTQKLALPPQERVRIW